MKTPGQKVAEKFWELNYSPLHTFKWEYCSPERQQVWELVAAAALEETIPSTNLHGRKGLVARKPTCLCGERGIRSDEWDAYYCPKSGEWLEKTCMQDDHGINCSICAGRPDAFPIH